jgi:hypothetical protein
MSQHLDEQPRRITARARASLECLFFRLDAGFEPDDVADVLLHAPIQLDEHVDRTFRQIARALREIVAEARRHRLPGQERLELIHLPLVVREGETFDGGLQEKVERIVDGHLRDEVHLEAERFHRIREGEPREIVALRILLPVHEVACGVDLQRIRQDARPAVRRRPQPHDLGRQADPAIVAVVGDVIQRDMNRHGPLC